MAVLIQIQHVATHVGNLHVCKRALGSLSAPRLKGDQMAGSLLIVLVCFVCKLPTHVLAFEAK